MLESISWQEFILGVSAALAAYYTIIFFFVYAKEIAHRLKRADRSAHPKDDHSQSTLKDDLSFIGAINTEPSYQNTNQPGEVLSAEDVQVNAVQNQSFGPARVNETTTQAPIAELLNELDTLFQSLSEDKSSKEEGGVMIKALVERYKASIPNGKYQHAINLFIQSTAKEALELDLQLDEIKKSWL
jgi:hypothetical protein